MLLVSTFKFKAKYPLQSFSLRQSDCLPLFIQPLNALLSDHLGSNTTARQQGRSSSWFTAFSPKKRSEHTSVLLWGQVSAAREL